jgi:hypothetical protein
MNKQPECPECEKLSKVSEESNKIGDFLDWLIYEKQISLCQWNKVSNYLHCGRSNEDLLAEYFDIDMDKVEKERDNLLSWLQENQ